MYFSVSLKQEMEFGYIHCSVRARLSGPCHPHISPSVRYVGNKPKLYYQLSAANPSSMLVYIVL